MNVLIRALRAHLLAFRMARQLDRALAIRRRARPARQAAARRAVETKFTRRLKELKR